MRGMEADEFMQELEDDDINGYYAAQEVKYQLKHAEQYGGVKTVAVGRATDKVANYADNRVTLTIEEYIYQADEEGTRSYKNCFIEADSASAVATIYVSVQAYGSACYAAIDRRTHRVIATWMKQ